MGYSLTKPYFLILLIFILFKTIGSQAAPTQQDTSTIPRQYSGNDKMIHWVKWTWQLPALVKKAFNKSQYKDWYIENITMYLNSGKRFYRLRLNNGSLLDGDHYDSFLKILYLIIPDSGALITSYTID